MCWKIVADKQAKCPEDKCEAFFDDVQQFADTHLDKFNKAKKTFDLFMSRAFHGLRGNDAHLRNNIKSVVDDYYQGDTPVV